MTDTCYECTTVIKIATLDHHEQGCVGESLTNFPEVKISPNTLSDVLKQVAEFVGCDVDNLELDACDEPGRVDASILETVDGAAASPCQVAKWEAGKMELWLADYSFYFERVTREAASLVEVTA